MTLVVDASVIVAALVDRGVDGDGAVDVLDGHALAAPQHMPIDAANILRRASLAGDITSDTAALAHGDQLALRVELFPYAPLSERCWQLRENVTAHDAVHVALAEQLDAPLATLDQRLAAATGPRCTFATPSWIRCDPSRRPRRSARSVMAAGDGWRDHIRRLLAA